MRPNSKDAGRPAPLRATSPIAPLSALLRMAVFVFCECDETRSSNSWWPANLSSINWRLPVEAGGQQRQRDTYRAFAVEIILGPRLSGRKHGQSPVAQVEAVNLANEQRAFSLRRLSAGLGLCGQSQP